MMDDEMMTDSTEVKHGGSLLLSIVFHVVVISAVFIGFDASHMTLSTSNKNSVAQTKAPIAATTINEQAVLAEMARIKKQEQAKQARQVATQRRLKAEAEAAKKARAQERRRMLALKKKIATEKKRQAAAEAAAKKRLASIKKQQQAEQQRLSKIKKEHELAEAKAKKAAALAKQRAEQARQQAQALAAKANKKQQIQTEVARYKTLLLSAIKQRWIIPENVDRKSFCRFTIKLAPGGTVLSAKLVQSSGDPVLDRTARAAIYKASPLPVPKDPDAFSVFQNITLTMRPIEVIKNA